MDDFRLCIRVIYGIFLFQIPQNNGFYTVSLTLVFILVLVLIPALVSVLIPALVSVLIPALVSVLIPVLVLVSVLILVPVPAFVLVLICLVKQLLNSSRVKKSSNASRT